MATQLKDWVSIWHRPYRKLLFYLLLTGSLVGGLVYLENTFLRGLVASLSVTPGGHEGFFETFFAAIGGESSISWFFLGAVFLVGLVRALLGVSRDLLSGRLEAESRCDLERQILFHLLHQGDGFFADHSSGEILNRLEVDLFRILDRRETLVTVWWSVLLILGNFIFFALADWRLASVVLLISLLGILVTQYASLPLRGADGAYFRAGDKVKMDFEDYIKAVPEIQVGGLFRTMIQRFRIPQDHRVTAYLRWVKGNTGFRFTRVFWPVLAFLAAVLVVVYSYTKGGATGSDQLALIPVLIFALPTIFNNVTNLVGQRVKFQIAQNSVNRILEYNSDSAVSKEIDPEKKIQLEELDQLQESEEVSLKNVTYRYKTADGQLQGGINNVSASFQSSSWTTLAGGAGSGKSTLCNLLLGRLSPNKGRVFMKETPLDEINDKTRWRLSTLMPQRVVLFDTTIAENLLLGRGKIVDKPKDITKTASLFSELSEVDIDILEGMGLADVCRLKALDMNPSSETLSCLSKEEITKLRKSARKAAEDLKVSYTLFSEENPDPERPVFEGLLGGRTDLKIGIQSIFSIPLGSRSWKKLADSPMGDFLANLGRAVVSNSKHLLEIPSYDSFLSLSPVRVDKTIWEERRRLVMSWEEPSSFMAALKNHRMQISAIRIGLTCSLSEIGETETLKKMDSRSLRADSRIRSQDRGHRGAQPARGPEVIFGSALKTWREKYPQEVNIIREILDSHWHPLKKDSLNPTMSWRDNLIFARLQITNSRQAQKIDESLLTLMREESWKGIFVREGLGYQVGRNGCRLSGGQCQLVALGRALLRRTPILVLDEPTSALDPARRNRVIEFLDKWKKKRILISISHDPELAKGADKVILMKDGQVAAEGVYENLIESSPDFKVLFRSSGL